MGNLRKGLKAAKALTHGALARRRRFLYAARLPL
jgi:hypothetical protein